MYKLNIKIYTCLSCQGPQDIIHLQQEFKDKANFELVQRPRHQHERFCCAHVCTDKANKSFPQLPTVKEMIKFISIL